MNDMNFENIDTLIKEAAQNASQPNFDEAAWNKMDQLLDKEFGKKKRRFFIWWWLLPIAIGGFFCAYYFIVTQQIIPANQNQIIHSESSKTIANKSDKNSSDKKTKIDQNKISNDFERKVQLNQNTITIDPKSNQYVITDRKSFIDKKSSGNSANTAQETQLPALQKIKAEDPNTIHQNSKTVTEPLLVSNQINAYQNNANISNNSINKSLKNDSNQKDSVAKTTTYPPLSNKKKEKVVSKFFIVAGAAVDASFIHINSAETAKAIAGIGFGYSINKRFAIQTGFFAGHKIYTAQKQDYNLKNYSFPYANNIQNINADCYVYEIPLALRYNITQHKKANWFTTAGLSSLFMKTENYDVYYNYGPNTPTHMVKWAYSNLNNHVFSVLTLSAGYEATLKKNVFISVEPYYKLPLVGVGEGQVKLSSIGLQLGLRYQFLKNIK